MYPWKRWLQLFSEKSEGKISVEALSNLMRTFPETDDSTIDDLKKFVSKNMDLNNDGTIGTRWPPAFSLIFFASSRLPSIFATGLSFLILQFY